MHSSISLLSTWITGLLAFASLQGALASPAARPARRDLQNSSLYNLRVNGPGLNDAALVPWDTGFFTGLEDGVCPAKNLPINCTAAHVFISNSTVTLNTTVSDQQIYLDTGTGKLAFIRPGETVPPGASTNGFSIQPSSQPGIAGNLIFRGQGVESWMTCPDTVSNTRLSRLYANVTGMTDDDINSNLDTKLSQCVRVDIALMANTSPGAYTFLSGP